MKLACLKLFQINTTFNFYLLYFQNIIKILLFNFTTNLNQFIAPSSLIQLKVYIYHLPIILLNHQIIIFIHF
jgi:hypothetical protein